MTAFLGVVFAIVVIGGAVVDSWFARRYPSGTFWWRGKWRKL